jgi:hypothetical protein
MPDGEGMINAHEQFSFISELVIGHKNRLVEHGCPIDIAWKMAEQLHTVITEKIIAAAQKEVMESMNPDE